MFGLVGTFEVLMNPLAAITIIGTSMVGLAYMASRLVLRGRTPPATKPAVSASSSPPPCPPRLTTDPFVLGSSQEHRDSIRRSGSVIQVGLADAEGQTEIGRGFVVDRSVSGLGLEVDVRLEPGTIVSVRPGRADLRAPWIQVEVASCTAKENYWRVGCKFVRTPPWSTMLLFG